MEKLTVVLQAGGESKRMGSSKALVPFCGAPLICRGLLRLGHIADELIITTNEPESLAFLCSKARHGKLSLCADVYEERSALNGMYTALYYAQNPYVAVVACDMIFPSAPILLAQRDILVATGADAVVPHVSHGYEPFHAVYRRETCLPLVKAALDDGQTRATIWYEHAHLIKLERQAMLEIDPRGGNLINVNTPQELAAIEQRILAGTMTTADGSMDSDDPVHVSSDPEHSRCHHPVCSYFSNNLISNQHKQDAGR
ncbi:MAG: molybdenum cofactor guanylyltransferase [Coriobacteriia bacterium]|nr:molybdenum cofactor guanylyltransferase [Coriobacteriia bacterium]